MDVSLLKNKSDISSVIEGALPVIFSVELGVVSDVERSLFSRVKPLGFILFGRNCIDPDQLKCLCADLRDCVGWHCPILIDQEGGRVQRLRPPHWGSYPACQTYGDFIGEGGFGQRQADSCLEENVRALSSELFEHGINVNCAPVLDVIFDGAHDIVGDRGLSGDINVVTALGRRFCQLMMEENVMPVIKHLPGHGRAVVDSHEAVTVIDTSLEELRGVDFKPFMEVAHIPALDGVWGMVAHCIYTAVDARPASVSPVVIEDIIRREIGFRGILVTDDLSMKALDDWGSVGERAAMSLKSGCDLALYCAGRMDEMVEIAAALVPASGESLERLKRGLAACQ